MIVETAQPAGERASFALWPLPELRAAPETANGEPEDERPPSDEELAHQRGIDEGRAAEREAVERELGKALDVVQDAARKLDDARRLMIADDREAVYAIALAIAKQVIHREVEIDPSVVAGVVERAITALGSEEPVLVRVNPRDYEALTEHGLLTRDEWPADMEWRADPSLERGGCVVDSASRMVDGRLESALREVEGALHEG